MCWDGIMYTHVPYCLSVTPPPPPPPPCYDLLPGKGGGVGGRITSTSWGKLAVLKAENTLGLEIFMDMKFSQSGLNHESKDTMI